MRGMNNCDASESTMKGMKKAWALILEPPVWRVPFRSFMFFMVKEYCMLAELSNPTVVLTLLCSQSVAEGIVVLTIRPARASRSLRFG